MKEGQIINVVVFEFEHESKTQSCTGSTYTQKDDAILDTWTTLQSSGIDAHQVKQIYSEWRPSPEIEKMIQKDFPNATLTYSFEDGDEAAYEEDIRKLHTKKWWEFWK